jgi:hypothetical protein
MITIRRAACVAAVTSMTGLAALAPVTAQAAPVSAGQLVYITSAGVLDVVVVMSHGATSTPEQIGPVTAVAAPRSVKATDLVVSGDGKWLAWSEVITKPSKQYGEIETGAVLAVRNMMTGHTVTLRDDDAPLGFAGHQLVVTGAHTRRLVMTPTPHLVNVPEGNAYPVATYAHGVVDVKSVGMGNATIVDHEQLRLTTFSGHHTVLHTYLVGTSYRAVTANLDAVSPDGKVLLVERGNHQDFDGLGPSSLFDTYSLGAGHARRQIGHYGTNAAQWRLATATFVGPHDTPWLALHSGYTKTSKGYVVHGVVVRYAGGHWQHEQTDGIAVAGNAAGFVVVQAGKWVLAKNSPDGEYDPTPTGDAVLEGPGGTHVLSIQGSQLLWVA